MVDRVENQSSIETKAETNKISKTVSDCSNELLNTSASGPISDIQLPHTDQVSEMAEDVAEVSVKTEPETVQSHKKEEPVITAETGANCTSLKEKNSSHCIGELLEQNTHISHSSCEKTPDIFSQSNSESTNNRQPTNNDDLEVKPDEISKNTVASRVSVDSDMAHRNNDSPGDLKDAFIENFTTTNESLEACNEAHLNFTPNIASTIDQHSQTTKNQKAFVETENNSKKEVVHDSSDRKASESMHNSSHAENLNFIEELTIIEKPLQDCPDADFDQQKTLTRASFEHNGNTSSSDPNTLLSDSSAVLPQNDLSEKPAVAEKPVSIENVDTKPQLNALLNDSIVVNESTDHSNEASNSSVIDDNNVAKRYKVEDISNSNIAPPKNILNSIFDSIETTTYSFVQRSHKTSQKIEAGQDNAIDGDVEKTGRDYSNSTPLLVSMVPEEDISAISPMIATQEYRSCDETIQNQSKSPECTHYQEMNLNSSKYPSNAMKNEDSEYESRNDANQHNIESLNIRKNSFDTKPTETHSVNRKISKVLQTYGFTSTNKIDNQIQFSDPQIFKNEENSLKPAPPKSNWNEYTKERVTKDFVSKYIFTRDDISKNIYKPFFKHISGGLIRCCTDTGYFVMKILDVLQQSEYTYISKDQEYTSDLHLLVFYKNKKVCFNLNYVSNNKIEAESELRDIINMDAHEIKTTYSRIKNLFERSLRPDEEKYAANEKRKAIYSMDKKLSIYRSKIWSRLDTEKRNQNDAEVQQLKNYLLALESPNVDKKIVASIVRKLGLTLLDDLDPEDVCIKKKP